LFTKTSEQPPYRIRKHNEGWCLSKWVDFDGIVVEAFLGSWPAHAIAIAAMDVHLSGVPMYPNERF